MITLNLTDAEAAHLKYVIDTWVNGHDEGSTDIQHDRSFEEPEEMLDELDAFRAQLREALEIRQKLVIAMRKEGDD